MPLTAGASKQSFHVLIPFYGDTILDKTVEKIVYFGSILSLSPEQTPASACSPLHAAAILFNALPLEIKQLVRTPLVSPNALISFSTFF